MIEGFLESLLPSGIFTGWLRDTGDAAPVVVEIRLAGTAHAGIAQAGIAQAGIAQAGIAQAGIAKAGGQTLARAAASAFRPDLLRGGHGHGHYGFRARLLVALPPGQGAFELFLPRRGQGVRTGLVVPAIALAGPAAVEALLRPEQGWTTADVLPSLGCLDLGGHLARLGPARYIDAAYRFALHRWPGRGETVAYDRALADGSASAEDVMRELLTSRERHDLGPELISPWDPGFPFTPSFQT